MEANVRIAVIKSDFTWEELFVEAGGANWTQVVENAEIKARESVKVIGSFTFPDPVESRSRPRILAVKAVEGWAHTVEEA